MTMTRTAKPVGQRGFSLVEMMIAVVLGIVVVGGLINLFIANRKGYQLQSGANYLQQNVRVAADRIGWSLRMADFWGGNDYNSININSTATAAITATGGSCTQAWATSVVPNSTGGGSVFGYSGSDTFPLGAACIGDAANYVKGSDVIVMRYVDTQMLSPGPVPAEAATIGANPSQVYLVTAVGGQATLFAGSPVPSTPTNSDSIRGYVFPYRVDVYYLRPCSAPTTAVCAATDDNGAPLPTLMRMYLRSDGKFISEAVIDGVEQLKVSYGVSAADGNSPAPTSYMTASEVTAANAWDRVVSAAVSVVAVSPVRDVAVPHEGTYKLSSDCTYKIAVSGADVSGCTNFTPFGDKPWQFTRAVQQFVVQLRNRNEN
ncbi:PilW family protein [Pinirhizobacter sp.]|jgi:prepilin-type N-terminal cleavage/methylation domain-containing protein|uniref:PilW family protein n=1 Tax=Pinirhizobacter sp. TaxID=2950432 RepID=UPI002F3EA922